MFQCYFSLRLKTRRFLTSIIIIFLVVVAVVLLLKESKKRSIPAPTPYPSPSIEQKVKEKFGNLVLPSDTKKMELKDVSGGEGFGIVTETEILAYLPDLQKGEVYKAWLVNNGKRTLLGIISEAKGGWILGFDFSKYSNYDNLVITAGSKDILVGSF